MAPTRRGRVTMFLVLLAWPVLLVDISGPPMADSALLAAMRLVDAGSWTLSDVDDAATVARTEAFDVSEHDGRVYAGVPPGASLVAAPVYAALRPVFATFDDRDIKGTRPLYYAMHSRKLGREHSSYLKPRYLLQICMAWFVVAPLFAWFGTRFYILALARGAPAGLAMSATIATCFGTMLLFYGCMYSRQALSCMLVWHGTITLLGQERSHAALLGVGALFGLALAIDYPSAILIGLTVVFAVPRFEWRERALVVAPIAMAAMGIALYHDALFGSPLSTSYHHRYWAAPKSDDSLDPSSFETGAYVGMGLPSLAVMAQLAFGAYKGLFIYSPVLLVGVLGHVLGLRGQRRAVHGYCLAGFLIYLALNSTMGAHLDDKQGRIVWGGLSVLWGPRHLLAVVPLLAYGLVHLDWSRQVWRNVIIGTVGLSVAVNVAGCMFKQAMMSSRAFSPQLESPIAFVLKLLFENGPRVTVLDAYSVPVSAQVTAVLLLLTGSVIFVRLTLKAAPQPPRTQ